jgi:hypothetical protein
VSPKNVVVAGLVVVSELEGVCEGVEPVWAPAVAANRRHAAATVEERSAVFIKAVPPAVTAR